MLPMVLLLSIVSSSAAGCRAFLRALPLLSSALIRLSNGSQSLKSIGFNLNGKRTEALSTRMVGEGLLI